jgi:creatinine amidohydrolase
MATWIKHPVLASCCLLFVAAGAVRADDSQRSLGGALCKDSPYNCADAANPLPRPDTVWMEDMTWMDVRDAIASGKTTAIVPVGGLDPNGPWIAISKHNLIVSTLCDSIARSLGNALCAPVVKFVPLGGIATEYSDSPGAIYVSESTYEAELADIVSDLKVHGFKSIVLIGDHSPDAEGMKAVADRFTAEWHGAPAVVHIPEFFKSWDGAVEILYKKGLGKPGVTDGLHDDPTVSLLMMLSDPESVRWKERVRLGKATIDGVSIADQKKSLALGKELADYRTRFTVDAIRKALGPAGH